VADPPVPVPADPPLPLDAPLPPEPPLPPLPLDAPLPFVVSSSLPHATKVQQLAKTMLMPM
jgi:hypothetical protein